MARADLAMRAAKQGGRNRVQFYDNMDNDTRKKLRDTDNYTSLIEEGLRNNNFYPVFQPIFDVPSGEVVGYETLARIRGHGNGPNESIGNVIAAAERYGFAVDVNRRIISMVADMLDSNTTWLQGKLLSFNFSAQSIGDAQIIDTIKRLTSTSVPPGSLIFEITETAALTSLLQLRPFSKSYLLLAAYPPLTILVQATHHLPISENCQLTSSSSIGNMFVVFIMILWKWQSAIKIPI